MWGVGCMYGVGCGVWGVYVGCMVCVCVGCRVCGVYVGGCVYGWVGACVCVGVYM